MRSFKWIGKLFCLCMLLSVLAVSASAAGVVASGTYDGYNTTWTLYTDGELRISGTGQMGNNNAPWCDYKDQIKSVVVEEGVTTIGARAFDDCSQLTSISIPDSVRWIESGAFYECTGLTSIDIPDSVEGIRSLAFRGCTGLTSIDIPDSVESIESGAFDSCEGLTSVSIPKGVTSIAWGLFDGCKNLKSVTIPDSVTIIEDSAFLNCESLASVVIPEGVTTIEEAAFSGCRGLVSVSIPKTVTSIGPEAFRWCESLKSVVIPEGVTTIEDYTFYCCESLTSVSIPSSVRSIGHEAFCVCTSLASVTIPDSVTYIGARCFALCDSLTSVVIPDSVTYIGGMAFYACSNLASITVDADNANYSSSNGVLFNKDKSTLICYPSGKKDATYSIPNSVVNISDVAFYWNFYLTSVSIPAGVASIGESAFGACLSLTSITVDGKNSNYASVDGILFNKDKTTLVRYPAGKPGAEYAIPKGVTQIESYAFDYCRNLEKVVIPSGVTSIETEVFFSCLNLKEVNIPYGVTSIGDCAFADCRNLPSIIIPSSVRSIGVIAFGSCDKMTDVYFVGDAPTFDKDFLLNPMWAEDVTLYYVPGRTGWTDSSAYDASTGRWNGYKLATWEGIEEEIPFVTADIIGTSPSNGKTVEIESVMSFYIRFDREISDTTKDYYADLDFTKSPFAIYRESDNALVYKAKEWISSTGSIPGTSSDIEAPFADPTYAKVTLHNSNLLFEEGESYYITMGEGFIKFADGSVSPAIVKGDWRFSTVPVFRHQWNFGNYTDGSREDLSDSLYQELIDKASAIERRRIDKFLNGGISGGVCFGMSSTAVLAADGRLSADSLQKAADYLCEVEKENGRPIIAFYAATQQFGSIAAERLKLSIEGFKLLEQTYILPKSVESKMQDGAVLLDFNAPFDKAHAMVGIRVEYGTWQVGNRTYNARIVTYDCNYPEGNEDSYVYFDKDTREWDVPNYPFTSLRLCLTAQELEELLSNKGISEDVHFLTSGECQDYSIVLNGETISIDSQTLDQERGIVAMLDSGYVAGAAQNMTLAFRDPVSTITVLPNESSKANEFAMNFDEFSADVKSDGVSQIVYSAAGSVEVLNSTGDCSVTLARNEKSANFPWFFTTIAGSNVGDIVVTENSDGVKIEAEDLSDITVTVSDFESEKGIAFSTEDSSVQIVTDNTGAPVVMLDKDGDGNYESNLNGKPELVTAAEWAESEGGSFTWDDVAGATSYKVYIYRYSKDTHAFEGYKTIGSSQKGETIMLPAGSYGAELIANSPQGSVTSEWITFTVYGVPGNPALKNMDSAYGETDTITFEWDSVENAEEYVVHIDVYVNNSYYTTYEKIDNAQSGVTRTLPAGKYNVSVSARNAKYTAGSEIASLTVYGNPGKPTLKTMKSSYTENETVTFTWDAVENAEYYQLEILINVEGETYQPLKAFDVYSYSYTMTLPEGKYTAVLYAMNQQYLTISNWVRFTVKPEPPLSATSNIVNDHIVLFVESKQEITTQVLHIALYSEAGQMIDYIIVPTVKPYTTTNVVFDNYANAKTAKVFLWDSLTTTTPIADAVEVTIR